MLPGESYATKESDGEATAVDDRAGGVACHQVIEDARRPWEMPERVVSTKPGAARVGLSGARPGGPPGGDAGVRRGAVGMAQGGGR